MDKQDGVGGENVYFFNIIFAICGAKTQMAN